MASLREKLEPTARAALVGFAFAIGWSFAEATWQLVQTNGPPWSVVLSLGVMAPIVLASGALFAALRLGWPRWLGGRVVRLVVRSSTALHLCDCQRHRRGQGGHGTAAT